MNLLAFDPGVRRVWFAHFRAGVLSSCGWKEVSDDRAFAGFPAPSLVLVEMPRVYPVSRQKGDPNDLLALARVVGRLQENFLAHAAEVRLVEPRTWKGTLAKEAMTQRIRGRLYPEELAVVASARAGRLEHNVVDAVGLGLHALGRLAPRKVVPR